MRKMSIPPEFDPRTVQPARQVGVQKVSECAVRTEVMLLPNQVTSYPSVVRIPVHSPQRATRFMVLEICEKKKSFVFNVRVTVHY